ncbi:MAG: tetratricopeptide repeat protein, partial [Acidobacteria bacterium Pan2503]|nr:tetratricopeptide repeat protein [Candidatus Acidoferrum panamensis]
MHSTVRRGIVLGGALMCFCGAIGSQVARRTRQGETAAGKKPERKPSAAEAYRLNTLGVAHLNQQRPADAQKYFEQALQADPKFAVARLNLGVALLGQQKLEAARAALTEATEQLPNDPYAWYNLGLALKDSGEPEKGIAAFQGVTKSRPNEADAYYFIGYLSTQLQKYDDAIAAFEKGLELNPVHASAEFGLARALQRKGDTEAARQHLARFQKITSEHLGTPFGAGYGDQGKFSTAELPVSTAMEVPAAIAVHFAPEASPFVSKSTGGTPLAIGASTGACFFDVDGDGRPDLFLVSGATDGASHLLRNLGNGRFEDITQAAGIHLAGSGLGCAAGDFDNDGKTDLAVCLSDGVRLLRNQGERKFEDVT